MHLPNQAPENEQVWSQRAWLLFQLSQAILCKWCLRRKKHFRNKKKKYQLSFQGGELLLCQLLNYFMFCPDGITGTKTRVNVAFILTIHNYSPVAPYTPTLRYSPILRSCLRKQIWTHRHYITHTLHFWARQRVVRCPILKSIKVRMTVNIRAFATSPNSLMVLSYSLYGTVRKPSSNS